MKRSFSLILALVLCLSLLTGIVSAAENPFTDVKEGKFYYDAVLWAVEKKVTSGTTATTFSPDVTCTRGQVVTFLWRAFGEPEPTQTEHPFTDVKESAYYYKAMLWAVENEITSGMTATTFDPNGNCNRGQVVTFLHRAAGKPVPTKSEHPFTDVKETAFYYQAMLWAVENGITSGMTKTTFVPNGKCNRGQVVTFLYRTLKDGIPEEKPTEPSEKPTDPTEPKPTECSHKYDNACDAQCNVCGEKRTPTAHVYDNACDKDCNVCGLTRTIGDHVYDDDCDASCNECGKTREAPHTFDNDCDGKCNSCTFTRETKHKFGKDSYGRNTKCSGCGLLPVSVVGSITFDREYVTIGDTFKASITVKDGVAPYTATWYYVRDGVQYKIEGATILDPIITATEEMFDDRGIAEIYCNVKDSYGNSDYPMNYELIHKAGKLEITMPESYEMWNVPDSYVQDWDIGSAYPLIVGGDGNFTYKWEYSRNKITWQEDTNELEDGFWVRPDSDTAQEIGRCIATREALEDPIYVRVTVSDGSGQTVTSTPCMMFHKIKGAEIWRERSKTLKVSPKGGDGTYEYEWYWCKNEFTGDLDKLNVLYGETGAEMTLTAEEIQSLKSSYCSTIVCKITSGGKSVYVDASFSLIMNDE